MWSLTSSRAERIGGPEKFHSSTGKDFFNSICQKQKCATAIGSSQLVQAPPTEVAKNRPKDVKLGAFNLLRPIVEHGKCRA
jgi:hypothetical protein